MPRPDIIFDHDSVTIENQLVKRGNGISRMNWMSFWSWLQQSECLTDETKKDIAEKSYDQGWSDALTAATNAITELGEVDDG